jgi:ABC-2 type transport system ATP-binding protein
MDRMDVGLSIVRSMPETRDVRVEDHRATVELEGDDAKVAELLDALIQQGVGLRSFNDKDPTLEDVFMLVTKGLVT